MSQVDLLKRKTELTAAIQDIINKNLLKCLQNTNYIDVMLARIENILKSETTGLPTTTQLHCHGCNAYVPLSLAETSRSGCDLLIMKCPHCNKHIGRLKLVR